MKSSLLQCPPDTANQRIKYWAYPCTHRSRSMYSESYFGLDDVITKTYQVVSDIFASGCVGDYGVGLVVEVPHTATSASR